MSPGFIDRSIVWGGAEGTRTIDGNREDWSPGQYREKRGPGRYRGKRSLAGNQYVVPTTVLLQ